MAMIGCESTTEDDILKSVNKKLYKELEESKENLENRKKDLRTTEDSMESIKVKKDAYSFCLHQIKGKKWANSPHFTVGHSF